MIWRTRNGRWLDRFGQWHRWYAWHPVALECPDDERQDNLTRAWLCHVARMGVIVRNRRFWIYTALDQIGLDEPDQQRELRRRAHRGEHLRAV